MTVQELYNRIGGNYQDVKARMLTDARIGKYVTRYPSDPTFAQLVEAWDAQDADGIFRASHGMKGVCANLGLERLRAAASIVTEAYRPGQEAGREAANVPAVMAQLKLDYAAAVADIRSFTEQN